jgi:hypothetical protein
MLRVRKELAASNDPRKLLCHPCLQIHSYTSALRGKISIESQAKIYTLKREMRKVPDDA